MLTKKKIKGTFTSGRLVATKQKVGDIRKKGTWQNT